MSLREWPDLTDLQTLVLTLGLATIIFLLFYPFKKHKK